MWMLPWILAYTQCKMKCVHTHALWMRSRILWITLQIGVKVLVCLAESAGKDGEPHLQDDIRREELDGECRDATEEEVEERPYPDWPAPHQITDTFRQNMTETGPLKCPDGPYPRSEASNRRFSKAYCYRLLSNKERIERDWLLYSKKASLHK